MDGRHAVIATRNCGGAKRRYNARARRIDLEVRHRCSRLIKSPAVGSCCRSSWVRSPPLAISIERWWTLDYRKVVPANTLAEVWQLIRRNELSRRAAARTQGFLAAWTASLRPGSPTRTPAAT
jgi:hypothetical protein